MKFFRTSLVKAAAVLLFTFLPLNAQENQPSREASGNGQMVRLFMDCQSMGCFDLNFLRTEIPFVNWVRDREDGDVYLLITSQGTGAGGASSELIFTGRGRFEGMADSLSYISMPNSTTDAQRRGLSGMIKIGLVRYVGLTSLANRINIGIRPEEGPAGGPRGGPGSNAAPEDDPWNFWVFSLRGSGSLSGESNSGTSRFTGSASADRVTEDWKISLSGSASYNESTYDYDELDYSIKNIRRDYSLSSTVVKSVAEHWSAGARVNMRNSTYYNFDFEGSISPVLEYSFFPYSESTRRSITLEYSLGANYANYREETIFLENEEAFLTQSLSLGLNYTQPWGTAYTIFGAGHHLEDIDKHHASVYGGVNLRISRGLSLNLSGSVSRIKDRISVALGAADTVEEVLLRRRQFQTDYSYRTSIGLTYRFGSMFNNVVNPRMGGGMGGMMMFF